MAGGVEEDDIGPAEAHREAQREWRSFRGERNDVTLLVDRPLNRSFSSFFRSSRRNAARNDVPFICQKHVC